MSITDSAGNVLVGNTASVLGYTEPEAPTEALNLRAYDFIISSIRQADQAEGNLFLKRYFDGIQQVWRTIQSRMFQIKDLWNIQEIEDQYLQYLKRIVGWTPDLDHITLRIDDAALRKLIASSTSLWKIRGSEQSYLQAISLFAEARARIWNWFDLRWILDETALGEQHQGRDPHLLDNDANATRESNLRIVDDGTLDRYLVRELVNLFRPSGERMLITYLLFLDTFEQGDGQWTSTVSPATDYVVDATVSYVSEAGEEYSLAGLGEEWADCFAYARIKTTLASDTNARIGLAVYAASGEGYLALLDVLNDTLHLVKRTGGVDATLESLDLTTVGEQLFDDVWYGLRVQILTVEVDESAFVLHDTFDGVSLDSRWTTYNPGAHVLSLVGGFRQHDPVGAVGFGGYPNRAPGPFDWQFVTGDFDARVRVQMRNDADSAEAPQTAFRFACLYVANSSDGPTGWMHCHAGVANSGFFVRVGAEAADNSGTVEPGTSVLVSTTHQDLRIVRIGQHFYHYHRQTGVEAIESDVGWTLIRDRDKTGSPMNDGVYVGVMTRSTSATDTLAKYGEFLITLSDQVRIKVFLDNEERIDYLDANTPLAPAGVGLYNSATAGIECSEVEVVPLPASSDYVDINH